MEFELEFLELERRKADAIEKIAESLNLISMSQASMALSPNNLPPFYYIPDPNSTHNVLNTFPRDFHITSERSDEDGSKA